MSPRDLLEKMKQLFLEDKKTKTKQSKKLSFTQLCMILLAVGIGVMILGNFFSPDSNTPKSNKPALTVNNTESTDTETFSLNQSKDSNSMEAYASDLEQELESILGKMEGVTAVDVMVVIGSTQRKVYEEDTKISKQQTTEEDAKGGDREISESTSEKTTVFMDGERGKQPILVTKQSPEIKGVIVAAAGAENKVVKTRLINAVSSVLSVPSYSVDVYPMNKEE